MIENDSKIAIVDDNRVLVDVLSEFLEGTGSMLKSFTG